MILPWTLALLCAPAPAAAPVMGSVVTSKEWIVHRGAKMEEEFIGDVRYHSGPDAASSDWALYKHATKQWRLKGHVVVRHEDSSGDVFIARGDAARLRQDTGGGELTARDRVRFERRAAEGGVDYGEAGRASWQDQKSGQLSGGVRLWGPRVLAWSDRADYDQGLLTLAGGRPVVEKLAAPDSDTVAAIKADVITATRQDRVISGDGRARGWIFIPKAAPAARAKGKR